MVECVCYMDGGVGFLGVECCCWWPLGHRGFLEAWDGGGKEEERLVVEDKED